MEMVYRLDRIDKAAAEVLDVAGDDKVLTFSGEMGAGKTTLIHASCRRLGATGVLSSPTYAIINEYDSVSGPLYHIDLYRCKNEEEVVGAGVEDCLYSGGRCFVEWPSRAKRLFEGLGLPITISVIDDENRRIIIGE